MFSFKKWAGRASAVCLLLSLSVAPLFSQAAAEQKSPQAKTKAEYDAYMLLYNEGAPAKKVDLAVKFLADHPETEFKMFVYQMQIDGYAVWEMWTKSWKLARNLPLTFRRPTATPRSSSCSA
jgi:hypothetical protein